MGHGLKALALLVVGLLMSQPVHASLLRFRIEGFLSCNDRDVGSDTRCGANFFDDTGATPIGDYPFWIGQAPWTIDFSVNTNESPVFDDGNRISWETTYLRIEVGDFRATTGGVLSISDAFGFGTGAMDCEVDGASDFLRLDFGGAPYGFAQFCGKDIFSEISMSALAAANVSELSALQNRAYCSGVTMSNGWLACSGRSLSIERLPVSGTFGLLSLGMLGLGFSARRRLH